MGAYLACATCGTEPREDALFCDRCGSVIAGSQRVAEYKQVTVLFADVVRSMKLAAVLDVERLREVMAGVFNRSAIVVQRYGGTVDKFTGDGIMALFGAPVALEDHAVRACLAALDIHREMDRLGAEVARHDGAELRLRIGLNSGRVIAGDIDSGPGGYTAVGEQVGLAQRMESVAPAGGVMLSESTAGLVEHVLALGEPEWVTVKGADDPLRARRLLAIVTADGRVGRQEPTLVGRNWELTTVSGILDRAMTGHGCVVAVMGSAGIGKSRIVREAALVANDCGQRARQIADQLDADDPNRLGMRIAPRALLCGNAYRIGGEVADTGFDELRELTGATGDKLSLAIGMTGWLVALSINDRIAEAARLATECGALIESIGDPALTVGLLPGPLQAKFQAGKAIEMLPLAQRVIDLADGDATMGNLVVGSPLATALMMRGAAEMFLGSSGFKEHYDEAIAMARDVDPASFATTVMFKYCGLGLGAYLADDAALRETADALSIAQQSGDPWTLGCALVARGLTLVHSDGPEAEAGYELLAKVRDMALAHQFSLIGVPIADIQTAIRKAQMADLDGAIELARAVIANLYASGDMYRPALATTTLVEALLRRGADGDIAEAQAAIDTLAAVPTDRGYVMNEVPLLRMRALLARVHGDEVTYRKFVERYRARAAACDFEGHLALAEAMA
jgi:class 3 adenylate cyclase